MNINKKHLLNIRIFMYNIIKFIYYILLYYNGVEKMRKLNRSERLSVLTKILSDNPNNVFTFNYFTENFSCAKSTLSEDVDILKKLLEEYNLGTLETISGAAGGVKYLPHVNDEFVTSVTNDLCEMLSDKKRILSGGFIYMTDIIYNPGIVDNISKIISSKFIDKEIDYVVTVETKGIPIALITAKYLNVPLVIVRRNSKVTEGSSVNINYLSTSTRTIQTMSLSRRAIKKNSKVLFVDDFMKGGGTARGIIELMNEFEASVEGISVLVSTKETINSFSDEYFSILVLNEVNEKNGLIDLVSGINYT